MGSDPYTRRIIFRMISKTETIIYNDKLYMLIHVTRSIVMYNKISAEWTALLLPLERYLIATWHVY